MNQKIKHGLGIQINHICQNSFIDHSLLRNNLVSKVKYHDFQRQVPFEFKEMILGNILIKILI